MARRFFAAGLPVPHDYRNADARPSAAADREYLLRKGNGDGRFVKSPVVPLSLRSPATAAPRTFTWVRKDAGTAFRLLGARRRTPGPAT